MFRTTLLAAMTVALMGGTALAQTANSAPTPLNNDARAAAPDTRDAPPAATQDQTAQNQDRDMFCRRDAAARTGYTTPDQARRDEQARGSIGGALGGAALGAIIGGAGHGNAGTGAAIGAGAGLLAGTAVGASNGERAARDVERDYADAYYACMDEADGAPAPRRSAYGYGGYGYDAPPPGYYGYPAYPYPYYYAPYYGPSLSFGFGFGGGGFRGYRGGFHGGYRHR